MGLLFGVFIIGLASGQSGQSPLPQSMPAIRTMDGSVHITSGPGGDVVAAGHSVNGIANDVAGLTYQLVETQSVAEANANANSALVSQLASTSADATSTITALASSLSTASGHINDLQSTLTSTVASHNEQTQAWVTCARQGRFFNASSNTCAIEAGEDQQHPAANCNDMTDGLHWISVSQSTVRQMYCKSHQMMPDGSTAALFVEHCYDFYAYYTHALPTRNAAQVYVMPVASTTGTPSVVNCISHTDTDARIPVDGLFSWYKADDLVINSAWANRVNPRPAGSLAAVSWSGNTIRNVQKVTGGGYSAHSGYVSIKGHSGSARFDFGPIVQRNWTLCTTSRYDGGSRGRIFTGSRQNFLHGHHGGRVGVSYYEGWVSGNPNRYDHIYDWVILCANNGPNGQNRVVYNSPNGIRLVPNGYVNVNAHTNNIRVGLNRFGNTEQSNFRIGEVMSWNRHFTIGEMREVVSYMQDRLHGLVD